MRSNRNIRVGLILIGFALLALVLYSLSKRNAGPQPVAVAPNGAQNVVGQPVSVPANGVMEAAMDIPPRTIITADMVKIGPRPTGENDAIAQAYFTDPAQVVGYITAKQINKGAEIQRATDVVGHISEVGVAAALNPTERAMMVPILNKPTLHDLVKVGDYVDIIAAFDGNESRTIVENVRVLAVDVFGKEFPQVSVAQRGDYKAAPKGGITTANPPSPASQGGQPASPDNVAPQQGQPGAPAAAPSPTPVPNNGAPPAKPEPSLTLAVLPEQARSLNLAQASQAVLDFVLRPRPAIISAVTEVRVASLTKPQLSPFAWRQKNKGGPVSEQRKTVQEARAGIRELGNLFNGRGTGRRTPGSIYDPPTFPPGGGALGPANVGTLAPSAPETYSIPIYGDGKMVRCDTVLKPGNGPQ